MPNTGAKIAGTGASLAGIGTVAWVNPGNITASDNTWATCGLGGGQVSLWLVATNFDFSSIPNDAVIVSVTGTVEASYTTGTGVNWTAAQLVVANAVAGTQLAISQALTASDANYTVDLSQGAVGYQITPTLLKTSTTGFAVSMTGVGAVLGRVDAMWLTVEYIVPGPLIGYIRRKKKMLAMAREREAASALHG